MARKAEGKTELFYGIVASIGEWKTGNRSDYRPVTAVDGQGGELKFLLFDNMEEENRIADESYENDMTVEFEYTETRKGDKVYTNISSMAWADESDNITPEDKKKQHDDSKGAKAQKAIAQRKGDESQSQRQTSIEAQVAVKEIGDCLRCPDFQYDIEPNLVIAYWKWISTRLLAAALEAPKEMTGGKLQQGDLVQSAKDILDAEETSRQPVPSKPNKKQIEELKVELAKQIDGKPEDIDINAAAVARFEKGHKVTGGEAAAWIIELQGGSLETPPAEDEPEAEELPF